MVMVTRLVVSMVMMSLVVVQGAAVVVAHDRWLLLVWLLVLDLMVVRLLLVMAVDLLLLLSARAKLVRVVQ
jgi:hypothetical protein